MAQKADFLFNSNFVGNGGWSYRDRLILNLLRLVIRFVIDYKEGFR